MLVLLIILSWVLQEWRIMVAEGVYVKIKDRKQNRVSRL